MTAKFGTSGLRGLNEDLIGAPAISYTRGFVHYLLARRLLRRGAAVLVARDFRTSSPALFENIAEALQLEGMGLIDFGHTPTPALAFAAMARRTAAIMITGSHIPDDRNGLKFYKPTGEIDKRDERGIVWAHQNLPPFPRWGKVPGKADEGLAASGKFNKFNSAAAASPSSVAMRHLPPTGEGCGSFAKSIFIKRYAKAFSCDALKGMRIGVYQHSTVARDLLVDVLQGLGAQVTPLGRAEKFVAVDTEAVSVGVQNQLKLWCRAGEFDAIVSADGDGDRPLVADEMGQVLRGDVLGLIAARALGAQVIVTPITSNSGLDLHLSQAALRTKVGSPHVIAAMMRARKQGKKRIVGFEANGGFFTASHFGRLKPLPTRDCVLPILTALVGAHQSGMALSTFVGQFSLPVCLSDTLVVPSFEIAHNVMGRLLGDVGLLSGLGKPIARNLLDGLRLTFDNGSIVHLRPSGNAPEFRIYVEGRDQPQAEAVLNQAREIITQMFSLR